MRAWLLFLAVLATFQTIVQVASTEDNTNNISSRFIIAITPTRSTQATDDLAATATRTALTAPAFNNPVNDISTSSLSSASAATAASSSTDSKTSSSIATAALITSSASTLLYEHSDSNSENNNNNNKNSHKLNSENADNSDSSSNVIIEIKNIEEIEGNALQANEEQQFIEQEIHEHRTDQSAEFQQNTDLVIKSDNSVQAMAVVIPTTTQTTTTTRTTEAVSSSITEDQQHKKVHNTHHNRHHHNHHQHHNQQITTSTQYSENVRHQEEKTLETQPHSHARAHIHSSSSSSGSRPPDSSLSVSASASDSASDSDSASASALADDDDQEEEEEEEEPATYSNKKIISEKVKPDPSTLVEIENSLLSLFNMKRPPKIDRSKIVIPEAMKKLYAQIMGHELDSVNIPKPGLLTKSANTVRSFTHQDSKIDDRFPHHHRFRLYFDIKSIPAEEKLKAAELTLTRDAISHAVLHPRVANRTRYQVLAYDITRLGVKGKREPSYLLLDNKTIRLNSTGTVSLDVHPAVERWLATPKKNFGLLIEVRTSRTLKPAPHRHVRLRRSADEAHEHWQHKQPLLFTYTDDGRHKARSIRDVSTRSKRAGHRRPHRRKNNEEICRRHSLYVDFSDVGWSNWIVAPPGYDAFYCHGKCPFPLAEHLNSTNHAVVQTLVNNLNPGKVPKACCVPTQLEGISMLYLNDQNTVVLKNYQDMTVVGCGCR